MAIIQCVTTPCKVDMLAGIHYFDSDVFKIALYDETADFSPATVSYTTAGEISGTGYTAGGKTLENMSIQTSNGSAWVYWDNVSWTGASFSARGALIYNSTKDDRAVIALDFGLMRQFTADSNTIVFPDATASTALMRIT